MTRRSPVRYLAPLAMIAVVVALFVIVTGSGLVGGDSSNSSNTEESTQTEQADPKPRPRPAQPKKTYVVRAGDSLTVISERTGVSVEELMDLNPDIDAQALQTGDKLKLQ